MIRLLRFTTTKLSLIALGRESARVIQPETVSAIPTPRILPPVLRSGFVLEPLAADLDQSAPS